MSKWYTKGQELDWGVPREEMFFCAGTLACSQKRTVLATELQLFLKKKC